MSMIILLPCYFESRTVTKYSYKNRNLITFLISIKHFLSTLFQRTVFHQQLKAFRIYEIEPDPPSFPKK